MPIKNIFKKIKVIKEVLNLKLKIYSILYKFLIYLIYLFIPKKLNFILFSEYKILIALFIRFKKLK